MLRLALLLAVWVRLADTDCVELIDWLGVSDCDNDMDCEADIV